MGKATRRTQHMLKLLGGLACLAIVSGCATQMEYAALPTAERPCPPWVEFPADRHSNIETAYLGCSNNINLRTTVQEASDLEKGRALGPTNGNRESLAAGRYETGQTKQLPASGSPTPTLVFSGANGAAQ